MLDSSCKSRLYQIRNLFLYLRSVRTTEINSTDPRCYDIIFTEAEKESEANKRVISEGEVTFAELKRYTIKAAEELYYDRSYITQLKHATTEGELGRIMATARERSYQD